MNFVVIIPARFASKRLPGKPLVDINGKSMIVHVMERAKASRANRIIVATDHQKVSEAIQRAGGEVCLTSSCHQSGTERICEVINYYNFPNDWIIVNVQGDEPLIPPQIINQVADNLIVRSDVNMTTLAIPVTSLEEAANPNIVKVVTDKQGYALYFSRALIPCEYRKINNKSNCLYYKILRHIGIYAYRAYFIRRYVNWTTSPLEQIELLEQLRVLWYGEKIHVEIACATPGSSVNTIEELSQVRLS